MKLIERILKFLGFDYSEPEKPDYIPQPDDKEIWCDYCNKETPHRWKPSPEAGDYWRCSECGNPKDYYE